MDKNRKEMEKKAKAKREGNNMECGGSGMNKSQNQAKDDNAMDCK